MTEEELKTKTCPVMSTVVGVGSEPWYYTVKCGGSACAWFEKIPAKEYDGKGSGAPEQAWCGHLTAGFEG